MILSARSVFSKANESWEKYLTFINFQVPDVLYSIDAWLNEELSGSGYLHLTDVGEIDALKSQLPELSDPGLQYYQMAINLEEEAMPALPKNVAVLGFDICDETLTSSLLNCGPWEMGLAPLAKRLNRFGLLSLEDAKTAQELLPKIWGEEEPHAFVDVWCICKVN